MDMFREKSFWGMIVVIILCMAVNVRHPHLWGPDEPREAEIARECIVGHHLVTPYFNGIPFVEKPPLYYDLAAAALFLHRQISGDVSWSPGAARAVSALLGALMLASLLVFTWKTAGGKIALTACALCLSMPQFYRAAHWILLDIGVGAFVTAALAACGMMIADGRRSNLLSALFFFFAGAAFLTKGVVTAVYIGVVILPWMLLCRKGLPFRLNWTMLFFVVPVGIWLALFYREGGVYYLHEHFINNIFGRFFHVNLTLPGSPVTISDVGNTSRMTFYFERMPNMFGAVFVLVPLVLAAAYRAFRLPFFAFSLPVPLKKVWDFLTAPQGGPAKRDRNLYIYLLCWTFIPLLFFSLPAIKEVTYLLPSYAGLAVLAAQYLERYIGGEDFSCRRFFQLFCLPCVLIAAAAEFAAPFSLTLFFVLIGVLAAAMAVSAVRLLRTRAFRPVVLLILAGLVGGVVIGNVPELMRRTRLHRKCYRSFSLRIGEIAGRRKIYLRGGDESIRGCLPFFGDRPIEVLSSEEALFKLLEKQEDDRVVLMPGDRRRKFADEETFRRLSSLWEETLFDLPDKADSFVMFSPRTSAK